MAKYMGLFLGALALILGLVLLFLWSYEVMFMIRSALPGILILCGVIAVVAGKSELKDTRKSS
jgi:hypothetical protein